MADIVERSLIYGPGERFVIWLQGCSIRCKGCWNTSMWPFIPRGLMRPEELLNRVLKEHGVQGVTILGGEPLDQKDALLKFVMGVKQNGLDVMIYTGYELDKMSDQQLELARLADILVAGPFIEELRDTNLRWRGSSNQNIISKDKYYQSLLKVQEQNEVEIHISDDGSIVLLGYPDDQLREELNVGGLHRRA